MKPILLLDGDQFLYRACVAVETEVRWDEENHVLFSNREEAMELALGSIKKAADNLFPYSAIWLAFTQGESFRKAIYPAYKESRRGTRKPMCFPEVKEALMGAFKSLQVPGLEADDIMGIWATRTDSPTIIVSDDKDMRTIPGTLYRQGKLEKISSVEADHFWLMQTLMGDSADGYPGCPGIGPATAKKVLDHPDLDNMPRTVGEMWSRVKEAYVKAGLTADDALVQARCARILRASDWDATRKEVILWTPNT